MKPKSYSFKIDQTHSNLIEFLNEKLPPALGVSLSKSKIRMLVFAGAVYIDGIRIQKPNQPLRSKSEVMVYIDLKRLQNPRTHKKIDLQNSDVIYEDEEIIVINKPAGIPTQATVDNARDHLYAAVQRYLTFREGKEVYVGLHHRLDYDTSGLILFTKKKSANLWVSRLFKERQIQKTYHAICVAKEREAPIWEIKNHIARAKSKLGGRVIHMEAVQSGGDFAHTKFKSLKKLASSQELIECHPLTGRTHQIRIHLKLSNQPILGDTLYGGPKSNRIYLHAKDLVFQHGTKNKKISIHSSYPQEFDRYLGRTTESY